MAQKKEMDYKEIRAGISNWLKNRISEEAFQWVQATGEKLKKSPEDWVLYTSFSAVPRHTGKETITFTENELSHANKLRKNWRPDNCTVDQLARIFLILSFADQGQDEFLDKIEKIFVTSDLGEAVALYKGLPLYPNPEQLKDRAAEGIRSNITTVFDAVALDNPYPSEYMDEGAWNQIVLKALFVESPLYQIIGIDERANESLAKMLVEYAHERWSAGRSVSPELWRSVGPYINADYADDIKKVLNHPDAIQQQAATLALLSSHYSDKDKLLKDHEDQVQEVKDNSVSWNDIGRQFNQTDAG